LQPQPLLLQPHPLPPRHPRLHRGGTRTRSGGTGTRSSSTSGTTGDRSPCPGAMLEEFLQHLDQFGKTAEISGQPAKDPVVSEVEIIGDAEDGRVAEEPDEADDPEEQEGGYALGDDSCDAFPVGDGDAREAEEATDGGGDMYPVIY
ncbi:hypothetical protein PanWU01x14_133380, partial [Parasponia andersonii]